MYCNTCGAPMRRLDPTAIYDPQPTSYIDRWECDEKECPAQGRVVEEGEEETEPTNCRQCGNPLTEKEAGYGGAYCDRCWRVVSDYDNINDYDEFDEEEDEVFVIIDTRDTCDHVWDGPFVEASDEMGNISTATCSKCGQWAIDHDLRHGP